MLVTLADACHSCGGGGGFKRLKPCSDLHLDFLISDTVFT